MVYSLTWLPDAFQEANLKFAEVADWRTRGRREMGRVRGIIIHHTAGRAQGNMPSLDLLVKGRSDLSGPLAQLGLGRDGTFYIIAAGVANHAGAGVWRGINTGNSSFIGIEVENTGQPGDAYPDVQMDALRRGVAAILKQIGADSSMVCGHKEFAPGRKIDPLWDMPPFREAVAALLAADVPAAVPIAAMDEKLRATLRRGMHGPLVSALQAGLGISPPTGNFGPVTEARLRQWQREHGLVPDGIAGPKTWATLDAKVTPSVAVTTAPAPSPPPGNPAPPPVTAPAITLPEADTAARPVTANARSAFTPSGQPFASRHKLGFYQAGKIRIEAYTAAHPEASAGISPGTLRALVAVMGNEGGLDSINSYDNSFLSFGIMQWTAGAADGEGELPALLARIRAADQAAFEDCFGRFGLGTTARPGAVYGRLTRDGTTLATARDKAFLRRPEWAYRFWRAGHHPAVCHGQIAHAAARFGLFAEKPVEDHPLRAWLTSELGMALLLDQHVNRPAHTVPTLTLAVKALLAKGTVPADPAQWTDADEARLIDRYILERNRTRMTDPAKRAARLVELAHDGRLSTHRGAFS